MANVAVRRISKKCNVGALLIRIGFWGLLIISKVLFISIYIYIYTHTHIYPQTLFKKFKPPPPPFFSMIPPLRLKKRT